MNISLLVEDQKMSRYSALADEFPSINLITNTRDCGIINIVDSDALLIYISEMTQKKTQYNILWFNDLEFMSWTGKKLKNICDMFDVVASQTSHIKGILDVYHKNSLLINPVPNKTKSHKKEHQILSICESVKSIENALNVFSQIDSDIKKVIAVRHDGKYLHNEIVGELEEYIQLICDSVVDIDRGIKMIPNSWGYLSDSPQADDHIKMAMLSDAWVYCSSGPDIDMVLAMIHENIGEQPNLDGSIQVKQEYGIHKFQNQLSDILLGLS